MKYVIVTVQFLIDKGFVIQDHWRKSLDGTKVILHYDLILPTLLEGEVLDIYEYDSPELTLILLSPEWTPVEEEPKIGHYETKSRKKV